MYNRYVPQSDGSFQKNRMPESGRSQRGPVQQQKRPQPSGSSQPNRPAPASHPEKNETVPVYHRSAEGFLRNLLPQGLDTGDLLIAVLLLLMAGDCQEDKNTALLTLALYLFL